MQRVTIPTIAWLTVRAFTSGPRTGGAGQGRSRDAHGARSECRYGGVSALSATSRPDSTSRRDCGSAQPARRFASAPSFGALIAIAVLAYVAAAGSTVATFNDFYREALPAYRALAGGHVVGFLRLGPAYVGSLVLRAPFALVPSIWGGGVRAMYFAAALPCVIAAPLFAAWLGAQPRRDGATRNRIGPMLLCVFNPLVLMALFGGHPEEILGAVLCVVGVVLAVRGSVDWAAVLLALAVVNKSSALVAVPVALVLAPAQRGRMLVIMAALVGAVMVPVTLARMVGAGSSDAAVTGATLGTGIGSIFNPPQLLWWFGAGSWIVAHARELIVLSSVLCAGLWWVRRARGLGAARDLRGSAPDGARTARRSHRACSCWRSCSCCAPRSTRGTTPRTASRSSSRCSRTRSSRTVRRC